MKAGNRKQRNFLENIYLTPIALVMALVPLIVHAHVYEEKAKAYLYQDEGLLGSVGFDFISWGKAVLLIGAAAGMLLLFIWRGLSDEKWRLRFTMALIPLGAYGLLAFLSACFSDYKQFAFHGMEGTYESVWVLLSYCVITFYAYVFLDKEAMMKKLLAVFKVSMTLLCLYGLAELIWGNPIGWEGMKYFLYSPSVLEQYGDVRKLNLDTVFLTFYNSNYVGSFLVLTMPVSVMAFLTSEKKSDKIWLALLFLMQWVLLTASEARSGFAALVVEVILLGLLMRKKLLKHRKWLLAGLFSMVVVFLAVELPNGFKMSKRIGSLFFRTENQPSLEKIETLADSLEITYAGNTLSVAYGGKETKHPFGVSCEGEAVVYEAYEEKNFTVWRTADSRFTQIAFAETGNETRPFFDVGIEGKAWRFVNVPEAGGYYYIHPEGKGLIIKLEEAEKALPAKYWSFGSGRGYIWAKSIPLLKQRLFLGSGPDTFYMVYPYNDYVAQSSVTEKERIFNRPHSMYLQTGIQTGVLSLLAFLTLAGIYVAQSFRLYWKKQERTFLSLLGIGILVGICGYLITGLVNDSMVGVAQQYWLFLGIGLAVNRLVKEQVRKPEPAEAKGRKK